MHSPIDCPRYVRAVPPSLHAYIERFVPRPSHDPDGTQAVHDIIEYANQRGVTDSVRWTMAPPPLQDGLGWLARRYADVDSLVDFIERSHVCASCGKALPRDAFSGAQLKRSAALRRCRQCAEGSRSAESSRIASAEGRLLQQQQQQQLEQERERRRLEWAAARKREREELQLQQQQQEERRDEEERRERLAQERQQRQQQGRKPPQAPPPVELAQEIYDAASGDPALPATKRQLKKLLARLDKEKSLVRKREIRSWQSPADGSTPLFAACQRGNLAAAELLLRAHFSVNKALQGGGTPLYVSCEAGNVELARW